MEGMQAIVFITSYHKNIQVTKENYIAHCSLVRSLMLKDGPRYTHIATMLCNYDKAAII